MIFSCMPPIGGDEGEVVLLAQSIRKFGGRFARQPIWVIEPQQAPLTVAARLALAACGVEIRPFILPEASLDFPFAPKVYAAAEAETLAGSSLLVWLDPDTLVLDEPLDFQLAPPYGFGACPVHLKNISSLSDQPVDGFWQIIYSGCGVQAERIFSINTVMDGSSVRAHFNAGLLVTHPGLKILNTWKDHFDRLYRSADLAPYYTRSPLYAIFVHQAVLAATVLACLPFEQIQIFPACYNLPLFLLQRFPAMVQRPVTARYDEYTFLHSAQSYRAVLTGEQAAWLCEALATRG